MSDFEKLIAFLLAQYDIDEQVARECAAAPWSAEREHDRQHSARHDPAGVLADIDSKRRVVAEAQRISRSASAHPNPANIAAMMAMQTVVKLLAEPFASREGYRETWRP